MIFNRISCFFASNRKLGYIRIIRSWTQYSGDEGLLFFIHWLLIFFKCIPSRTPIGFFGLHSILTPPLCGRSRHTPTALNLPRAQGNCRETRKLRKISGVNASKLVHENQGPLQRHPLPTDPMPQPMHSLVLINQVIRTTWDVPKSQNERTSTKVRWFSAYLLKMSSDPPGLQEQHAKDGVYSDRSTRLRNVDCRRAWARWCEPATLLHVYCLIVYAAYSTKINISYWLYP